jgi:4-hydroxy-3-methylbut-2-en-1-yl diphosphate reductase
LLAERQLDLMIVIGGYNSSNTSNLARICHGALPTYHIADPEALLSADAIRHKPVGATMDVTSHGWLPPGPVSVGLTAGASTPDILVEMAMKRLEALANRDR